MTVLMFALFGDAVCAILIKAGVPRKHALVISFALVIGLAVLALQRVHFLTTQIRVEAGASSSSSSFEFAQFLNSLAFAAISLT